MTSPRVLWVTWEGGGTSPPELAVVGALLARGSAVRVLGDPCLAEDVARVGASFSPFERAPHRTTRALDGEVTFDFSARTPLGAFLRARDRHAFRPAARFAADVLATLASHPADVVVVDAMLFGALLGAERSGLPFVAVIPMTSFMPRPDAPPPGLGLRPHPGLAGRARDRLLLALGDRLLWAPCGGMINEARAGLGLAPLRHPLDQVRRARRVLVLSSSRFDFDAPTVSGDVEYTGPILADPVWAEPARDPWAPDDPRPLVLVTLGSSYQGQEPLLRRIVEAMATLPVRAFVTLGPGLTEGAVTSTAENVVVARAVRHSEVLGRAALVLTHGGHGTVLRSLSAGVPLLVFPIGRDQPDNAARVEWLGAGRALSAKSSAEAIASATAVALRTPGHAREARRFAAAVPRDGPRRAAAAVEATASSAIEGGRTES